MDDNEVQFVGFVKEKVFSPGNSVINYSLKKENVELLMNSLNDAGYVNIDIQKSRKGTWYAKLNDWSIKKQASNAEVANPAPPENDLPF